MIMKLRNYSQEIYSVITILCITLSAIFIRPDLTQQLALAYMFLFLLHMWEENVYPGGFFDMLFGEVIGIEVPSEEKIIQGRVYVDLLVIFLTFLPYFGHMYAWLILPVAYLGLIEGFFHNCSIKIFKMNRTYTPGMVSGTCQFILSLYVFYTVIVSGSIEPWQYVAGLLITLLGLAFMQINGMRLNGIKPSTMPKLMINNLKRIHGK